MRALLVRFPRLLGCLLGVCTFPIALSHASSEEAATVVHAIELRPAVVPPNSNVTMVLHFDAVPMGRDFLVKVSFRDAGGKEIFNGNHYPPFPTKTSIWSGPQSYDWSTKVLHTIPEGNYAVVVSIVDPETERAQPLAGGSDVKRVDENTFQIGELVVDASAPPPPLDTAGKPVAIDLSHYELTFADEFDGPLDVSAGGPGTRWIAHTPYGGDFGEAKFVDPRPGFPFTTQDGLLRIEARKTGDKWESGLLSSVDSNGNGFAQKFGYFEMRAKFPKGPGTWPAFWLLGTKRLKEKIRDDFEVDIVEQYGHAPQRLHNVLHWWFPDGTHRGRGNVAWVEDMSEDFHLYSCSVEDDFIVVYFDRKELWRVETPEEAKRVLYVLINLALGPGWPIDQTPNPSYMWVDYVRVYQRMPEAPTP